MVEHLTATAEQPAERLGQHGDGTAHQHADHEGKAQGRRGGVVRVLHAVGPVCERDVGRDAVLERGGERDDGEQDRRRDRDAGELIGAEPPDDRGVDQDVERLDREGAEGRDREADDPPVERAVAHGAAA